MRRPKRATCVTARRASSPKPARRFAEASGVRREKPKTDAANRTRPPRSKLPRPPSRERARPTRARKELGSPAYKREEPRMADEKNTNQDKSLGAAAGANAG